MKKVLSILFAAGLAISTQPIMALTKGEVIATTEAIAAGSAAAEIGRAHV